jgi:hypothetical protein
MHKTKFAKKYIIARVFPHQGKERVIKRILNDLLIDHFCLMNQDLKPTLANIKEGLLHDYQSVIECKYTNDWFALD